MAALQCALCPFRAQCGGKLCSAGGAAFKGFSEWAASSAGAAATSAKKGAGSSWINDMGNEYTETPEFHEYETAGPEVLSRRVAGSGGERGSQQEPSTGDKASFNAWATEQGVRKKVLLEWSPVDSSLVPPMKEEGDEDAMREKGTDDASSGRFGSWGTRLLDGVILVGLVFIVYQRFRSQVAK
eukprot:TRINITY_DN81061_c0_g1_i1.p1 TRINITY_DN81061_c0_g1~~TRINITY_DN81061_c0_g1_i1.p1  ORF type:complete len:184 (+),score=61.87 TRINITY_DN81061_c0_g1_i1:90-641(+)